MDQKIEFICEWLSRKYTFTELCKEFKISRPTVYKIIHSYENLGIEGLREHSKAPSNHPNQTKEFIVEKTLFLKAKYPQWGAKKIHRLLFNDCPHDDIPSVVTVHNILAKNGLVCPQKRLRRVKPVFPIFDAQNLTKSGQPTTKESSLWGTKYTVTHLLLRTLEVGLFLLQKGITRRP